MTLKVSLLIFIYLLTANLALGQGADRMSVAITVYNSNLGVVKDVRKMDIQQGRSEISIADVAQYIDPTSVHIKLNGEVIEQNYQYDLVSLDKILNKYLDKQIQLINEKGEVLEGKLLSSSGGQIVLEKTAGGLLMLPNLNNYRISVGSLPEGLITKPTLVWLVNSESNGTQDVEISYQTSGMNWHAEYVAVLNQDDTKLDLNSWVSVENNSGTTYKNAKLKLVAGDVNLVRESRGYNLPMADGRFIEKSMAGEQQFEEKEFFEYHIYNLTRSTDLAQRETKQISLFESSNIEAKKKFYYQSGRGYSRNRSEEGKVAVIVEFENKKENKLGIPMPKGKVRMYKSDGESIEFVGEDLN